MHFNSYYSKNVKNSNLFYYEFSERIKTNFSSLLRMHSRESVVLGSKLRNGDFNGFTHYKVTLIGKLQF